MKRWPVVVVSTSMACVLMLLTTPVAHAQQFEKVPDAVANVLVKMAVIIDGVLGHWVSGSALSVDGSALVNSIAHTVVNVTDFFAVFVTLF